METTRQRQIWTSKKMADSRFAILMALFLPNEELFTNFVMFNHAWKHEEDRKIIFRDTQNGTCHKSHHSVCWMYYK